MQTLLTKANYDFDTIKEFLRDDLKKVNQIVSKELKTEVSLINDLSEHIISSGGKKIRPIITLISSHVCDYNDDNKHIVLAAAVEFIHTATLLHDDVIDESKMRRGEATANDLFGNKASVLVGDFLFTRAFELMVSCQSLEILRILSRASAIIAQGEVLQLSTINDCSTSEKKYLEVVNSKTASLFSAAAEIGPILSKKGNKKRLALKNFGEKLGVAFQLIDDALDYTGTESMGKTTGDDFREGKLTLPVIECIKNASSKEKTFWIRTMEKLDQNEEDFNIATNLINKHNAIQITKNKAMENINQALKELEIFSNSKWKSALESIAVIAIHRTK